jgi:hypothetical protein
MMKQSDLRGSFAGFACACAPQNIRFGLEPRIVLGNLEETASTAEGFFHHAHRAEEGLQVAWILSPRFYGGFKWNRRVPW